MNTPCVFYYHELATRLEKSSCSIPATSPAVVVSSPVVPATTWRCKSSAGTALALTAAFWWNKGVYDHHGRYTAGDIMMIICCAQLAFCPGSIVGLLLVLFPVEDVHHVPTSYLPLVLLYFLWYITWLTAVQSGVKSNSSRISTHFPNKRHDGVRMVCLTD